MRKTKKTQQARKPRIVWLVKGENCFSEDGEVTWTVGLYSSKAKAEHARAEAVAECRENRPELVIFDERESGYKGGDWDREYAIESHRLNT